VRMLSRLVKMYSVNLNGFIERLKLWEK
jgi:hypothetical protein